MAVTRTRRWRGTHVLLSLVCTVALAATACGDSAGGGGTAQTPLSAELPQDVRDAGKLRVATQIGKPPGTFKDESGKVVGMHVDLMEEIGRRLGVAVEWQYTSFDGIIPGIQAKRYDLSISQIGDFASREKVVSFVNYQKSGFSFLTKAGNKNEYADAGALCGLRVATAKGSAQTDIVTEASADCQKRGQAAIDVQTFPGFDEQLLALQSDRVDVVAGDSDAVMYVGKIKADTFRQTGPTNFVALTGIPMAKDRTQLGTAVAKAIQSMMDDGKYLETLKKWGQEQSAVEKATINEGGKFGWGPKL